MAGEKPAREELTSPILLDSIFLQGKPPVMGGFAPFFLAYTA